MSQDKDSETHPSYGIIQFNRVSHGGQLRLFGTELREHGSTIELVISPAECIRSGRKDRYRRDFGSPSIVRLELSSLQYAELLTTMNHGEGVPCTLRRVGADRIDEPPEGTPLEVERISDDFRTDLRDFADGLDDEVETVAEIMDKDYINKGDRREVVRKMKALVRKIDDRVPGMLDDFQEAASRLTSSAKAEMAAFADQAGLTANSGAPMLGSDTSDDVVEIGTEAQNPRRYLHRQGYDGIVDTDEQTYQIVRKGEVLEYAELPSDRTLEGAIEFVRGRLKVHKEDDYEE